MGTATNMASEVSTHAPARGATVLVPKLAVLLSFQPTHPHGVRLYGVAQKLGWYCFNPRTRTGCDSLLLAT